MAGEYKYYDAKIVIETMNEKGKIKKTREHHVVWGCSMKDVENKVNDMMDGTSDPWSIAQIKESDIIDIYGKGE